jgi:hypothetical protein
MKEELPKHDEFYIGYVPKAPDKISKIVRTSIFGMLSIGIIVAALLVYHQKKFSTANFEYGVNTTLEGYIFAEPFNHLLVSLGKDIHGKELYQTILLVGEGKAGADSIINVISARAGKIEGLKVSLTGYLLYGNGKALMQVNAVSNMKIQFSEERISVPPQMVSLRDTVVTGEIVDPKCYFGVMKPGEGKAHRSCAIRCIAGGIPPAFNGYSDYFLLMNEQNEVLHSEVINIVGDRLSLTGKVTEWNDWKILQVESDQIAKLSHAKKSYQTLIAMQEGMTLCRK